MKFFIRFALIASLLFAAACAERIQPIYNPTNVAMPSALYSAKLTEIGDAIVRGGQNVNWQMKKLEEGKIGGTFNIRTHQAVVEVDFSKTAYSIKYVSSIHLLADGSGIHHNYNIWVGELQDSIDASLRSLATKVAARPATTLVGETAGQWESLKDSRDLVALLNFAQKNQDNLYGKLARDRLNMLMNKRPYKSEGRWRVTAVYSGSKGSPHTCPVKASWKFILNVSPGRISRTIWDGRDPLYVTGEDSGDDLNLTVNYPNGGSDWEWDKRFKVDGPDLRFFARARTSGMYSCIGSLSFHMVSLEPHENWKPEKEPEPVAKPTPEKHAAPEKPADTEAKAVWNIVKDSGSVEMLRNFLKDYSDSKYAPDAIERMNGLLEKGEDDTALVYSPYGRWSVTASYLGESANPAWCPNKQHWSFPLNISGTHFSKESWDGKYMFSLNGQVKKNVMILNADVPKGGSVWDWSEKNLLDGPDKSFILTAKEPGGSFGSCIGSITLNLHKQ